MNTTQESITENTKWSLAKKALFFFVFFYSFFYIFPSPLDQVPGGDVVFSYYSNFMDALTMFTGTHILHIQNLAKIPDTGSGDTTFDYVRVLTLLLLSLMLTIVMVFAGRKKNDYNKLFYLLYVSVRYYLALFMIIYGFSKVFKSQFPSPSLSILEERYGNSSPMGLLWNFMGYSTAYTVFAGMGEVLCGVLLLFRRTVTIGALLTLFVMLNVVALNFCYDVPVKLFSAHLVLFSLCILTPNIKKLWSFFVLRKDAVLTSFAMPFKAKWLRITRVVLKVIIYGMVVATGYFCYTQMAEYGDAAPKPPLYGIYKTQLFIHNHDTLKALTTDSVRWDKMIVDVYATRINRMNEHWQYVNMKVDTVKKTIDLTAYPDTAQKNHFVYTLKNDTLVMHGNWRKDTLLVKLHRVDYKKFALVNRGFHWINEYPYNR